MSDGNTSRSNYVKLERGLYGTAVQLRAKVLEGEEDFVSLLVKRRGPADFIAVLKFQGEGGKTYVAFGSGYDFIGVLIGLEGTLAANRVREDTPYNPASGG